MDTRGWFASVVLYLSCIHCFCRTAQVAIPATAAGQKVPVVFHLHGKPCVDNIYNVDMPAEYSIHYRQAMAARATPDLSATSWEMTASSWLRMVTREAGEDK